MNASQHYPIIFSNSVKNLIQNLTTLNMKIVTLALLVALTNCSTAQNSSLRNQVTLAVEKTDQKLIGWREIFMNILN